MDADFVVGWSFDNLDVGVGVRYAKFTTTIEIFGVPATVDTVSAGPMVYLGGGDLFRESALWGWGYYGGVAWMFLDLDDDPRAQTHVNAEGGIRWTSKNNISILVGYRHKEYFGGGSNGLSFTGPVVNLAFTKR